jgi:hypothetical protein
MHTAALSRNYSLAALFPESVSRGSVCARTSARRLFIARRRRDEFYCLYSIMTALAHFYGRAQRRKILISRGSRFSARRSQL